MTKLHSSGADTPASEAILLVKDLAVSYGQKRSLLRSGATAVQAVRGVSFQVQRGETLGIVGESGCGKSSIAKAIMGLVPPSGGSITVGGHALAPNRSIPMAVKTRMQMIFQDPYSSLNPRKRVEQMLQQALRIHTQQSVSQQHTTMRRLLGSVDLGEWALERYPHEFSGGQRQRLAIARSLAVEPDFIVCDEPVSALDVSVQAQILNLLVDLQQQLGLAYLFISHDLSVIRYVSERCLVIYLGRVVEEAPTEELFQRPQHPYTQLLLSATPVVGRGKRQGKKTVATANQEGNGTADHQGCRFRHRCPRAVARCEQEEPSLDSAKPNEKQSLGSHKVACFRPLEQPEQSK